MSSPTAASVRIKKLCNKIIHKNFLESIVLNAKVKKKKLQLPTNLIELHSQHTIF